MLRPLGNFWILRVTTIVLACFSNAVAQTSYKVTDLGREEGENAACAMSVNDEGWTEIMAWNGVPGNNINSIFPAASGRALIDADGFKLDLGGLGGKNTWMNWGEINDFGQIVGMSETAVPDPNGEDICGFGTKLTCKPFLWQEFHMRALPTLGGNNGQASAINNRGQIAGMAEDGTVDSSCPTGTPYSGTQLPVLWENGKPQALPTGSDTDGFALWINDYGQAVGYTGSCGAMGHAVVWENGTVTKLEDLGNGNGGLAYGNNDRGQIVGSVFVDPGGFPIRYAALWQNGVLKNLKTLPGDLSAIATGINDQGQVVCNVPISWYAVKKEFLWVFCYLIGRAEAGPHPRWRCFEQRSGFPTSRQIYSAMFRRRTESGRPASSMQLRIATPTAASTC